MKIPYSIFLLFLLLVSQTVRSQSIHGSVYDAETKLPVVGATIALLPAGFSSLLITDAKGQFKLEVKESGILRLQVSHVGYEIESIPLNLSADSVTAVTIALQPAVIGLNKGVVVTANRYQTTEFHTAEAVTVLRERELLERSPRSAPEALMGATGIWVQKTNHGGGSPFVRGLTGQQTLLMIDGIRLNNATFRSGPNQYFNTIDPQSISRIEVLRGAGSVQYGSDALGGIIQVFTREPSFAGSATLGGSSYVKYMSADMEKSARAEISYGSRRLAVMGGFALRSFGDLLAGGNLGTLRPTGYNQLSGDVKAKLQLKHNYLLTIAYQQLNQEKVPLYHKVTLENYQYSYFDPQKRALAYARLESFYPSKWWRNVSLTLVWQASQEGRVGRKNESFVVTREKDNVDTKAAIFLVNSVPASQWTIQSGIEYYVDKVNSRREDEHTDTQPIIAKRGLYPDGAHAASLALFSLHTLQIQKFRLSAGGRLNTFALTIPETALGTATINPRALVANLSALYALHPHYHLTASVNTAFRAPNIDDMGTLGIVDFRYELPNNQLQPEKSLNMEAGVKMKKEKLAASVSLYRNHLTNIISRVRSGKDSIAGYQVYRKANQAEAFIQGIEGEVEGLLVHNLALYSGFTYTYGQNITGKEPYRRIPPLNARAGLYYRKQGFWSRLELLAAAKQSRLSQGDIDDNRIADSGTPGWHVLNLGIGYQYRWFLLSSEFHNIFNKAYRTHGSGVDAYGRSLWFALRIQL